MRHLAPLLVALVPALAAPAAAQQACRDGMEWTSRGGDRPLALYRSCETGEVAAVVGCRGGEVRVALGMELPRSEPGAPVALDFAVDGEIHTLAGNAIRTRGAVIPQLAAGPDALQALIGGDRASIAGPEGALEIHLTGSARAIRPVRAACAR